MLIYRDYEILFHVNYDFIKLLNDYAGMAVENSNTVYDTKHFLL